MRTLNWPDVMPPLEKKTQQVRKYQINADNVYSEPPKRYKMAFNSQTTSVHIQTQQLKHFRHMSNMCSTM